ncbi:DUF4131 domain-containing protein [Hydrogenophaga aromaticivorans]|uniref:ComEC/Rec2 family competence protein n=1 Tax=Hydrogenophaga aromaticivorans TaxID=2610898 RepID=UPI001B3623DE|nr:ComEC/Rec2 family competence protein [Hydrogenophaga aromaticivorans]MBQ0917935.1 DUF4131 domain-containing protein [Hydrogenophaga aromaticivorans]
MAVLALAWLPGWVLGVAWQLQQAALWPWQGYAALLLASGLLLAGLLWRGARGGHQAAWLLMLAMAAGAWAGAGLTGVRAAHLASQALDPALQGLDIEVTGRIHSMPRRHAEGARFELAVESAARNDRPVRLPPLLQLAWYSRAVVAGGGLAPGPDWRAGERWRLTVRLSAPHGNANPHGFDRERWLWENGIGATGYVRNGPRDALPQRLEGQGWYPLEAMRQTVGERIAGRVDDPRSAGVLAALVVGDQSAIERVL